MKKDAYIKQLLEGHLYNDTVLNAAFVFYHSDIPLKEAEVYMKNLRIKVFGPKGDEPVKFH